MLRITMYDVPAFDGGGTVLRVVCDNVEVFACHYPQPLLHLAVAKAHEMLTTLAAKLENTAAQTPQEIVQ